MMLMEEGLFKMLKPAWNRKGFWIVGGIVGYKGGLMYTKRVSATADLAAETERIKIKIMADHPGVKQSYGDLVQKH